jgi:hypothetical protein
MLRRIDAFGRRLKVWKTNPILRLRTVASLKEDISETSSPSSTKRPVVGVSRQPMMCMSVDLPEPDGPMTATIWPFSTSRSTPRRAATASSPAS